MNTYGSACHAHNSIMSFVFLIALPAHLGPWPLIQFRSQFSQMVGLFEQVISPSQGLYLNTGHTQTQNKRIQIPDMHALSGIRAHDPCVRAIEDSSCLRRAATVTGYNSNIRDSIHTIEYRSEETAQNKDFPRKWQHWDYCWQSQLPTRISTIYNQGMRTHDLYLMV
jgi:hypothetical protein